MSDENAAIGLIDCDVHPSFREGVKDLAPYLSRAWQRRFGVEESVAWRRDFPGNHLSLPRNFFYTITAGAFRRDAGSPDGGPPASDPAFVAHHLLDRHGIDRAVLIGGEVLSLGALPDPDAAAAIASAFNDWLTEAWLEADPRYRGAMLVPAQHPEKAAAEIRRLASRDGFVCAFMPLTDVLLGDEHYAPVYAACHEHGLPLAVHITGTEGMYARSPTMPGGVPSRYLEWKIGVSGIYQTNLASCIARGVFERFPSLKVVMTECGFAWLAEVAWRMDGIFRALRDDTPWLRRPPSEYIAEHVRFTTQPFIEPPAPSHIAPFLEMVGAERLLLFSSDYPHHDFDDPSFVLGLLPETARPRVRHENALEFFGERMR